MTAPFWAAVVAMVGVAAGWAGGVPPPPVFPEPPPLQPATVAIPRKSPAAQQGKLLKKFPALVSIANRVRIPSFVVIS
jgi:hypothetical protein